MTDTEQKYHTSLGNLVALDTKIQACKDAVNRLQAEKPRPSVVEHDGLMHFNPGPYRP